MERKRIWAAFVFVILLMLATLSYEIHRTLFNTQQVISLRTNLMRDYFKKFEVQVQAFAVTFSDNLNKNSRMGEHPTLDVRFDKQIGKNLRSIQSIAYARKKIPFVGELFIENGLFADTLNSSLSKEMLGVFSLDGQMQVLTKENREIVRSYYTSRQNFFYSFPKGSWRDPYIIKDLCSYIFLLNVSDCSRFGHSLQISGFYNDPSVKNLIVSFSEPVFWKGKVIGAVSVDVSLEKAHLILNSGVSKGESYLLDSRDHCIGKGESCDLSDFSVRITPDSYQKLNMTGKYFWTAYKVIEGKMVLIHKISILEFIYLSLKNLIPYWALILTLSTLMILNSKLKKSLKTVSHLSNSDYLTGISNRRYFLSSVQNYLTLNRKGEPWAVLMVDIDFFKNVNDRFGHDMGDLVLVQVARLIDSIVLKPNFVSRWGGEEFAILLCNVDPETSFQLAEFLRKEVEQRIFLKDGSPVTLSIGVAEGKIGGTFEEACTKADRALYQAKENGRNRVFQERNIGCRNNFRGNAESF
ncbi:diguanylate cyclase [Leptospira sp. 201903070]|uniref:diguanylate cyclase n=1 Tax=Leptospira ainlahdjerensis TaxID=2810033 RepID=A0ABS2U9Q5_9LEPT|nr:sensor domain-containing diguanylate cyclase [Leptospira ainlahdjerensis]MBM9577098.1 diguanylate cyclase [Leptospira ainlahdjerensis]